MHVSRIVILARRSALLTSTAALCASMLLSVCSPAHGQGWMEYGENAQHSTLSSIAAQPMQRILWQTPVDLQPQYSSGLLFIHYGTPLITKNNTIIVPVKTGATDGFQFEGHSAYCGALKWTLSTDYSLPQHDWTPSCAGAMTTTGTLYIPAAGGTVLKCTGLDGSTPTSTRIAFYGVSNFNANPSGFDGVRINTPITCDSAGNIYFGFFVTSPNPLNLVSGIARISSAGKGTWVPATISQDSSINKVAHNCAPALSTDKRTLYVAFSNGNGTGSAAGYLVALNATTLAINHQVRLKDAVNTSNDANIDDDGTSSPMVGPDGDVYYGVLENPWYSNLDRGWMLHFDRTLTKQKITGAFGWDDTASVVPASAVPSYSGHSSYLILTKYNKYYGTGGGGKNEVAVLDPNATETDPLTGATVMNEVITVLGVTQDPGAAAGAVREWCINSAAIDPITKCAIINSEDGNCYRWDFTSNTLMQSVNLAPATGEAYTPTLIGPDGTCYAINNATLFAIGPNVANVTKMVTVTHSKIQFNTLSNQYQQVVTITNKSDCDIQGPISLVLDNLSAGVTLGDANGKTVLSAPAGSPYINLAGNDLAPGSKAQIVLTFSSGTVSYTPRVLAGVGSR